MSGLLTDFYVIGGTLRRDAPCYVVRKADHELYIGLNQGKFCYVLTSRQMGKSSLMVRTAARLREEGTGVVILDLTAIGQNLSAEQWYRGLLGQLGYQLELEDELAEFWHNHMELGPVQRWMRTVREVVMPRYPGPVVIFVDEIDVVRSLPFSTDEFFAAIREFYNRRTEDKELERLTFCLLGVATPSDLIRDTRTTPFNIGRRIELHDFTEAEALSLAQGLNYEDKTAAVLLKRIHYWTGGHPYLTQRLCQAIADNDPQSALLFGHPAGRIPQSIDSLCEELFFSPRAQERDDNLLFVRERMLRSEVDLAGLLGLYEKVQRHKRVRDDETNPLVSILLLSGIARVERGYLRERNRIYARVFDREWTRANVPDAEMRRQRAAFRRGLLRATAVSLVIIAAVTALAFFAIKQRNIAEQARAEALSRELAANAIIQLPLDPELSVLLAIEALRIAPTTQAEDALRQSVPQTHVQAVMRGHKGVVSTVGFSPDSKRVVTGSADHTARVWEARTGRSVAQLLGHTGVLNSAHYSPDGNFIATSSRDHTARVWEAGNGQCIARLSGHTGAVTSAAFSPDSKLVVTSSDDKTARIWEVRTGRELIVLRGHLGSVWNAAFTPDGQYVVTASADETASVWAVRTGQSVVKLRDNPKGIGLRLSPDGKSLVTWSSDGTARVWETLTGRRLAVLRGHTSELRSAAFSPDSRLVATGSIDSTARIWEARTGHLLQTLRGHTSKVRGVRFSPDGTLVVTTSFDSTARVWELSSGECLMELRGHTGAMDGPAFFSPDGEMVVTGSKDGTARVWSVNRRKVANELRGHTDYLLDAGFSPDGRLVATASRDRLARIWEVSTGRSIRELRGHTGMVNSVAFSKDGRLVITASADRTARLWEVSTGHSLQELRGHTDIVMDANFSPDGQYVVTASKDGTALVWETRTGRSVLQLLGHSDMVCSAAFSADGKQIVTASYDKTVRIWEANTGNNIIVLRGHQSEVSSAAFSPEGRLVVTASFDTTARVWDIGTGQSLRELRGHKANLTSASFSPDGQYIVTSSFDGTTRVWDMNTGLSVVQLRGHSDEVWSAAYSPDGNYIVTGSYDKTARIFDCTICRPLSQVLSLAHTRVTRGLTPEEKEKYLHERPPR